MSRGILATLVAVVALGGCATGPDADGHGGGPTVAATLDGPDGTVGTGDDVSTDCGGTAAADHPDVIVGAIERDDDGTFTITATLCSAYDSPDRYADAFRVVDAATGDVLGVRELTHPHADEQPFTRSLTGVEVPADVTNVVVEGRDLVNGWGGASVRIDVPAR